MADTPTPELVSDGPTPDDAAPTTPSPQAPPTTAPPPPHPTTPPTMAAPTSPPPAPRSPNFFVLNRTFAGSAAATTFAPLPSTFSYRPGWQIASLQPPAPNSAPPASNPAPPAVPAPVPAAAGGTAFAPASDTYDSTFATPMMDKDKQYLALYLILHGLPTKVIANNLFWGKTKPAQIQEIRDLLQHFKTHPGSELQALDLVARLVIESADWEKNLKEASEDEAVYASGANDEEAEAARTAAQKVRLQAKKNGIGAAARNAAEATVAEQDRRWNARKDAHQDIDVELEERIMELWTQGTINGVVPT